MLNYIRSVQTRRSEETGASAVEYGLLVALIAAVIVVAVIALGGLITDTFNGTCDTIAAGYNAENADAADIGNCTPAEG